jgi:hypothetical protein
MATKKPVVKKTVAKKIVAKKVAVKKPAAKKTVAVKKAPVKKPTIPKTKKIDFTGMTPKQTADAKGEPWVSVVQVELDPDNIGNGAFELDWNDKFITNLVRAGYKGKTDSDMVDLWFQDVCKNVVAENFEQWEANQPIGDRPREIMRKDLGDGRTEVS